MSIQSGNTYKITNGKSGTILDLSGTDGRTISGFSDNGGGNQRWQLQQGQRGQWTFRNVATGQYLGIDGPIQDGTPVVSCNDPVEWNIYPDERDSSVLQVCPFLFEFLIFVPNAPTAMNVDLSDHGNAEPGTIVTLWGKWEGKNQTWRFEEA
ncbi:ricin B lectin domain-containing protein [Rhodocollybia butyracea]|uniref:Ricin B lectin domain-containing protein n=1 Tax=Rhodocollybia butyracea TaxID=206335 RepID=A0A9P5Q3F7_9AGAR|nr:ricin B lectin domain-containing protein [Rhodocollybia butyracea]